MKIIKSIKEMKSFSVGRDIGFVPTMGFLHDGHMSLIKKAREENDIVVVSIYVNPTQFAPNEDLDSYPRNFKADEKLCEQEGVDVIFFPSNEEMYPEGYSTDIEVKEITEKLCGKSRPTHFAGVTTIVAKLFDIIKPVKAYFGQKDYQQSLVIRKMVKDLNINVEIIVCPIVREGDGLAMSSRNKYLSVDERKEATVLFESLQMAKKEFESGNNSVKDVKEKIISMINNKKHAKIDYVEILDKDNLEDIDKIVSDKTVIALAVKFDKARLIDNTLL